MKQNVKKGDYTSDHRVWWLATVVHLLPFAQPPSLSPSRSLPLLCEIGHLVSTVSHRETTTNRNASSPNHHVSSPPQTESSPSSPTTTTVTPPNHHDPSIHPPPFLFLSPITVSLTATTTHGGRLSQHRSTLLPVSPSFALISPHCEPPTEPPSTPTVTPSPFLPSPPFTLRLPHASNRSPHPLSHRNCTKPHEPPTHKLVSVANPPISPFRTTTTTAGQRVAGRLLSLSLSLHANTSSLHTSPFPLSMPYSLSLSRPLCLLLFPFLSFLSSFLFSFSSPTSLFSALLSFLFLVLVPFLSLHSQRR